MTRHKDKKSLPPATLLCGHQSGTRCPLPLQRLQAGITKALHKESPPQEAQKEMQNKREGCKLSCRESRQECGSEDSIGKVMLQ